MATYVLIHGAGSDAWYWHRVVPLLRGAGHDVVAADLLCDDDSAGLAEYADTVLDAIGDRQELILVAQSLAGFTAPLVCDRIKVDLLVLLVAMIPRPGEPPGEWWSNTGWQPARRAQAERDGRSVNGEFDPMVEFLHDVPADVMVDVLAHGPPREQSGTPFEKPWPLAEWPDVPTEVLICRDDRFFPAEFMRRVARERLGITPDEMAGGHLPALSRADDLAARLETYRVEHGL